MIQMAINTHRHKKKTHQTVARSTATESASVTTCALRVHPSTPTLMATVLTVGMTESGAPILSVLPLVKKTSLVVSANLVLII